MRRTGDQQDDLTTLALFEGLQACFKLILFRCSQGGGFIHYPSGQCRDIALLRRQRGTGKQQPRPQPPGRASSYAYLGCVGDDSGLEKSTLGGLAMACSFSTENVGLTLWLNIIAVRLLGKERTVVL